MAIPFSSIPPGLRKPGVYSEYNYTLAARGLPVNDKKLLLIAPRLASGSVAEAVPKEIFSDADAALYFGNGSGAHRMALAAFKAANYARVFVVGVNDNAGGAAATGTITFTGPATSSGTYDIWIAYERLQLGVTSGDSATTIAAALVALITARPDLPVSAANEAGVVTLTYKHKGTLGNLLVLKSFQTGAAGTTAAIVAMASGATDPDIATALTAVFPEKYDVVACAWSNLTNTTTAATYSGSNVEKLKTHILTVSNAVERRRARAVIAQTFGLSLSTTLAGSLNSERMLLAGLRGSWSLSMEVAAAYGAVWATRPDPAEPLNYLQVAGIHVPDVQDRYSQAEQGSLLKNGVTPLMAGPGETVQIVRSITTYTLNAQGAPDATLLDTTTIDSMDYADTARRARLEARFPRPKKSARVKKDMVSEVIAVDKLLEELEILHNVDAHKGEYRIEDDPADVTVVRMAVPTAVVPGLHVLGMVEYLSFS